MDKGSRILISGAGVAGLTCAIWLGRNGFKPVIVEKAPKIRADGYIISLSHKSYQYAKELNLLSKLQERYTGIQESCYYNRNGKAMLSLDYQKLFEGIDIVQIMRDELESVLYEEAKDLAEYTFSNSLTSITQNDNKVQVEFSDGKQDEFDLLIGSDGLHSVTRNLAFDHNDVERKYFGLFSSAFKLPNSLGLSNRFENHMEQNRYMCIYTTGKGDLASVFIWKNTDLVAPAIDDRIEFLKDAYRGAPDLVQNVISQAPVDEPIYMDPLIQIHMQQWHKGRVAVVGDAASCLTLLSGQGASSAFWAASKLSKSLIEHDHETAFKKYQAELMPVVKGIQARTGDAAKWYIPAAPAPYYLRDLAMTYLPNRFFQSYFRKKYSKA